MNTHYTSCFYSKAFFVLLAFFLFAFRGEAQVRLVVDLDPAAKEPSALQKNFHFHSSSGSRSFFVGDRTELWTSDGTTAGTKLIKRFLYVHDLLVVNEVCYINAQTEEHGMELWVSDGTPTGTKLLKDIFPGRGSSNPIHFTNLGGLLFFAANNDIHGRELWKSDGTAEGTQLVKDIDPGRAGSVPSRLVAVGDKLFFSARTEDEGTELWTSDGSPAGTSMISDINPGEMSSFPYDLVAANGLAIFSAYSPSGGRQLWRSNGTATGTSIIRLINPGRDAKLSKLTVVGDAVFFQADDGIHGLELWKTDGTSDGTQLVKDLTPGPGSNAGYAQEHLDDLTEINGHLFFRAVALDESSNIWMSDGTAEGTRQLTFFPYDNGIRSIYPSFYEISGAAYFTGLTNDDQVCLCRIDMDGHISIIRRNIDFDYFVRVPFAQIGSLHYFISNGYYWKTDGTSSGTSPIRTLGFPAGSFPSRLTDVNGTLYFETSGPDGLWKTNGTAATTEKILDKPYTDVVGAHNDLLFMSRRAVGLPPSTVWRTDGTAEGTILLSESARFPRYFYPSDEFVFFPAYTNNSGEELWRSDGTIEGTQLVKDIAGAELNSSPRQLMNAGGNLFFTAITEGHGRELWRTNGYASGTFVVKDIFPGSSSSGIQYVTRFKDKIFFHASDGVHGYELWQSNGSNTFTFMVKDLRPNENDFSNDLGPMAATKDWLFFSALNQNDEMALWKTDGTASGTSEITTLKTTEHPQALASTESQAFFLVRYNFDNPGNSYLELWGASAKGAQKLATFRNQHLHSAQSTTIKGNTLYFITRHIESETRFLWRSDGSPEGTYQIDFRGQPEALAASGPYVYLSGNAQTEGHELFIIEESTSIESVETDRRDVVVPMIADEMIGSYPNPFIATITLNVPGEANEVFALSVTGSNGQAIGEPSRLSCNADHQLGASWPAGLYIFKIQKNDRITTRKVIKLKD